MWVVEDGDGDDDDDDEFGDGSYVRWRRASYTREKISQLVGVGREYFSWIGRWAGVVSVIEGLNMLGTRPAVFQQRVSKLARYVVIYQWLK